MSSEKPSVASSAPTARSSVMSVTVNVTGLTKALKAHEDFINGLKDFIYNSNLPKSLVDKFDDAFRQDAVNMAAVVAEAKVTETKGD